MEGYVDQNIAIEYNPIIEDKTILVNFFGCNFNCPFCPAQMFREFKSEAIIDTRIIKQELQRICFNVNFVMFNGGEPTLQRIILNQLMRFSKNLELNTIIHTNGSKPNAINDLIENGLVDVIILEIKSPFEEKVFQKITQSGNFFMTPDKIINEIKKSIEILRNNRTKAKVFVTTPIVPTLNFNDEMLAQIYEVVKYLRVPWVLTRFDLKSNDFDKDKFSANREMENKEELKEIILKINKANLPFKII